MSEYRRLKVNRKPAVLLNIGTLYRIITITGKSNFSGSIVRVVAKLSLSEVLKVTVSESIEAIAINENFIPTETDSLDEYFQNIDFYKAVDNTTGEVIIFWDDILNMEFDQTVPINIDFNYLLSLSISSNEIGNVKIQDVLDYIRAIVVERYGSSININIGTLNANDVNNRLIVFETMFDKQRELLASLPDLLSKMQDLNNSDWFAQATENMEIFTQQLAALNTMAQTIQNSVRF